ncbi:MAG: hypothetical protein GC191_00855 [Azospirillum sp.]|nr:hypothetical protein [Azospirillum sp.]
MRAALKPPERSTLTIARLTLSSVVPREQFGATVPAADAGRFVRHDLIPALAQALTPILDDGNDAVWVIRRLDLDLAVDAAWTGAVTAARLAAAVGAALAEVVAGRAANAAIRFPDRASYLAQFLDDLAAGCAFERWYYPSFRGLGALPTTSAVRIVLERDAGVAIRALSLLGRRRRLTRVLGCLSEPDAARLVGGLFGEATAIPDAALIAAAAEVIAGDPALVANRGRAVANLALSVVLLEPGGVSPAAAGAAAAWLLSALDDGTADHLGAAADRWSPADGQGPRAPVPAAVAAALDQAVGRLRRAADPRNRPVRPAAPTVLTWQGTCHAGVFLLWRSVRELGLETLSAPGAVPAPSQAFRHLLAALLAGPGRQSAWSDPALAWLSRIEDAGDPGPATAAALATLGGPADRVNAVIDLVATLRPPRPLVLAIAESDHGIVLADAGRNEWLFATSFAFRDWRDRLVQAAARFIRAADVPAAVLVPPGFEAVAAAALGGAVQRSTLPGLPVQAFHHAGFAPGDERTATLARVHAAFRPTAGDLDLLTPVDWPGLEREAALWWAVVARLAYADLARRVPGLALSSAGHLHRNLIDGDGRWRLVPALEQAEVELPAAPLTLLLRMAGVAGTRVVLADRRAVTLRLAEEG